MGSIYLFLQTIGVSFDWFTEDSIDAFSNCVAASIALAVVAYGIYKNTYVLTSRAREEKKILDEHKEDEDEDEFDNE